MTQSLFRLLPAILLCGILSLSFAAGVDPHQKGDAPSSVAPTVVTLGNAPVGMAAKAPAVKSRVTRKSRQLVQFAATETLLNELDVNRYLFNIETLANFKTRYTTSQGCEDAAKFLVQYFRDRDLKVRLQPFQYGPWHGNNVLATLPGTDDPNGTGDFIVLGAHYDSIARDANPVTIAPGAEDNASGVAALMELAELLHHHPPRTTIVFAAFSGEEEGLLGSRAYVEEITANGTSKRLRVALIMDMIGFTEDDDLDILFETDAAHEPLIAAPIALAKQHTRLRSEKSLNPFGSDHVPFLDAKLPAFLVIENDWDAYPAYHRFSDVPLMISPAMSRESLRVVGAWTVEMANLAEAAPVVSKAKFKNTTLVLEGDNFRNGAMLEIGTEVFSKTKLAKSSGRGDGVFQQVKIKDSRIPTLIPAGKPVTVRVVNPSGMKSAPFTVSR